MPDGTLVISAIDSYSVPGVGRATDLIRLLPDSLGDDARGSWSMYLDGSRVSLAAKSENINEFSISALGQDLLSTSGSFDVPGIAGTSSDVFAFNRISSTSVIYDSDLFFKGSSIGLTQNINAFDVGF
ncbi:MAG: hypothetical protein VKL39_22125 [Leptolyngbyaceae bacterium]|nr:hypothetical protein [Leptolyngbyaceae bacterium]